MSVMESIELKGRLNPPNRVYINLLPCFGTSYNAATYESTEYLQFNWALLLLES